MALLKNLLKYGLGLGLLAFVVYRNWDGRDGEPGLKEVLNRPINMGPLALAAAISIVGLIVTFLRWHLLVAQSDSPFLVITRSGSGCWVIFTATFCPLPSAAI